MKTKTKLGVGMLVSVLFVAGTISTQAISMTGYNTDEVKVKIFTKPSNIKHWFRTLYLKTDKKGVLEVKNVLPAKYKLVIKDADQKNGQRIAARFKMLDADGTKIKKITPVDVYRYTNKKEKVYLGRFKTDKEGWLELSTVYPETIYKLDVKEDVHLSKKPGRVRIKVRANIDSSGWFRVNYKRTDKNHILKLKNVPSGKYKFSYKSGDAPLNETFTLRLKMLNQKTEKIKSKKKVKVYSYINGTKTLIGETYTDTRGWVTLPGVVTKVKYKIKVVN